ncbi:MAG: hypothetical protein OEW84_01805, partial [Aigarchaeota archaeon]|nr:hypothetical protein [Aigarchaeota archaeon]
MPNLVSVAKIFEFREEMSLSEVAKRLKDYSVQEIFSTEEKDLELLTEIKDLQVRKNQLRGLFSRDKVVMINQRGNILPIVKTIEAPLVIHELQEKMLLSVLQEKYFANSVASVLSQILFVTFGGIVEAQIPSETLQEFHERNPDATKVIFFDDIDIPNVDRLALYGSALKDSTLYEQYLSHGKIWYVVYTSRPRGLVIGLTR